MIWVTEKGTQGSMEDMKPEFCGSTDEWLHFWKGLRPRLRLITVSLYLFFAVVMEAKGDIVTC